MTTQNREPPAFQEYASDMMSRREYRSMTLTERGLMDTLRRECWVNRTVPSDPALMAKVLGFQAEEIRAALPKVMAFFTISGEDIFSAELDAYRAHLAGIRRAKSDGGRQGAAATNKMRQKAGKS